MSYLKEWPNSTMQDFLYFNGFDEFEDILNAFAKLMKQPSQLTHADREMIAAYCNSLQQVPQPMNVHTRCFELLGGEGWKIPDLVKDPQHRCVDEKYRPLLSVVRKLTLDGTNAVCGADVEACYDAGWDGDAIRRTVMLTAALNMMLRWVSALGIQYDAEEIIHSSNGLTQNGYNGEGPGLPDPAYNKEVLPRYIAPQGRTGGSKKPRGIA